MPHRCNVTPKVIVECANLSLKIGYLPLKVQFNDDKQSNLGIS